MDDFLYNNRKQLTMRHLELSQLFSNNSNSLLFSFFESVLLFSQEKNLEEKKAQETSLMKMMKPNE